MNTPVEATITEYVVERILTAKGTGAERRYYVKWQGVYKRRSIAAWPLSCARVRAPQARPMRMTLCRFRRRERQHLGARS